MLENDPGSVTYDKALDFWLEGDPDGLLSTIRASMTDAQYRDLIVDRNRRWLKQIDVWLNGGDNVLVVVGAAHLAGPDGLPRMLRKRGFEVEGP